MADNRSKITPAEYDRYNSQFEVIKQVCFEYESENPNDSEEVKKQRFDKITSLMTKVRSGKIYTLVSIIILIYL